MINQLLTRYALFLAVMIVAWYQPPACAESIRLTAVRDNTLYQYDPADPSSELNSNGSGDFFSAGRSLNRSQIRRGLLLFDLSALPPAARVVPGSLQLDLYIVDTPRRDATPRPFWLVPADVDWGEGASTANAGVSGSGSGAAATAGDATWFHTHYDPTTHDGHDFVAGGPGYWPAPGALGAAPLDPAASYGESAGTVPSEIGPVSLRGPSLESDVNQWLAGRSNFGWIVLGDETLVSDTQSSVRGFASHEHHETTWRPTLSFEYLVPEPASGLWLGIGAGWLGATVRRRRTARATPHVTAGCTPQTPRGMAQ